MTSSSNSGAEKSNPNPSSAAIDGPIFSGGHSYVPKPLMKTKKKNIWNSQVLIPFSLACVTNAFSGHLPRYSAKSKELKEFFPGFPPCKPRLCDDLSMELGFMDQPNHILCSSPHVNIEPNLLG